MKKRIINIFLIIGAIFTLSACSTVDTGESSEVSGHIVDESNLTVLTSTYIEPIALSSILSQQWNDASEIDPDSFNAFYVANFGSTEESVTAEEYETSIQQFFNVSTEHLQKSTNYSDGKYQLLGIGSSGKTEATAAKTEGDLLTLECNSYDPADELIRTITLTIELNESGFKYISSSSVDIYPQ